MPFVFMVLIAGTMQIVDCCGAGMLETMWQQAGLLYDGCDWIAPNGGCDEMWASLSAELDACLSTGCTALD